MKKASAHRASAGILSGRFRVRRCKTVPLHPGGGTGCGRIPHVRGSFLHPLWVLVCFVYGAAAVSAQEPLQTFRHGETLALVPLGDSARLELPGGRSLRLALPERTDLSALALLDAGWGNWAVAGSAPNATGGRSLLLFRGNDKQSQPLAEPPGQEGFLRRSPVLLVDGGRLSGLAWLEGDDERSLSVRAAAWTGRNWGSIQQVSHPGPGSQLALTGAVLDDGSWLLAWSAFDGTADEIVWSRRVGETWLAVSRLSKPNAVPDITPALTATPGGGALIAWSRYDGQGYQLRLARFAGGEWQGEHAAAPSGSLYPTFLGLRLLYMDADPRAWSVLDLDSQGRVKAKASVFSTLGRPVIGFAGQKVRMRWPAEKREVSAPLDRTP
jgi:hypothetical protein